MCHAVSPVPPLAPPRSFSLRAQAFRLIRMVSYLPWVPRRRSLIKSWFSSWGLYFWLELMHWTFLWCWAVLGARLFEGVEFREQFRIEYDTLIQCLVTTYLISVGNTWQYMIVSLDEGDADWFKVAYCTVYVVVLVLMGLFIMTSLFMALQIRQISHDMSRAITVNAIYGEYAIDDPRMPCVTQLVEPGGELTLIGEAADSDAEELWESEGDSECGGSGTGGGPAGAGEGPPFAPTVDAIGAPRSRGAGDDPMPHSRASRRVAGFVVSAAFQWLTELNILAHCVFVGLVNDKASDLTELIYTLGLALCLVFFAVEVGLKVRPGGWGSGEI